jgi:hypothetical protein
MRLPLGRDVELGELEVGATMARELSAISGQFSAVGLVLAAR